MHKSHIITVVTLLVALVLVGVVAHQWLRTSNPTTMDQAETHTITDTERQLTDADLPAKRDETIKYASVIEGAGASFQFPQIVQWSSAFRESSGITVNYQSVGSGAGQRMFLIDKVVHFAASDPPLAKSQWESHKGNVLQVPWIMGAVVVIYNIPGIDVPLNLTGEVIARICRGEVVFWDDPLVVALNPQVADRLPNKEIIAVHRSDSSGTTNIFTLFLHKSAPHV